MNAKNVSDIFFNASLIEAEPCSSLSMPCGSQICQSRALAHLPAQLPAATAQLSIITSFYQEPRKTLKSSGFLSKILSTLETVEQRLERGSELQNS